MSNSSQGKRRIEIEKVELSAQVFLIEATGRAGGRVLTHYGEDWFGDLGPMRLPPNRYIDCM